MVFCNTLNYVYDAQLPKLGTLIGFYMHPNIPTRIVYVYKLSKKLVRNRNQSRESKYSHLIIIHRQSEHLNYS